ncbi:hypothetical protein M404DRAFT_246283 [Pisolithus tinctorius Marx 270]|uniref:Uncharacterized protein n=1 Tax=Pisolithus tinctorius Marx 270 TaxID=870435 RepID=A0A0C3N5R1_PISTI|nr:hypothetical protein M404DRAFT_246283 [Pisolithus tinctorius Marx 270]
MGGKGAVVKFVFRVFVAHQHDVNQRRFSVESDAAHHSPRGNENRQPLTSHPNWKETHSGDVRSAQFGGQAPKPQIISPEFDRTVWSSAKLFTTCKSSLDPNSPSDSLTS